MNDYEDAAVRKLRGIRDTKDFPEDVLGPPLTLEEKRTNAQAAETLRARLALYSKPGPT
jgi:hypothetical protein